MVDATPSSLAPAHLSQARARHRRPALKRWLQRRSPIGFSLALPLLMVIGGLVVYPALYAINLATMNKAMTKHIGFGNFSFLFTRETFWMVVRQSAIFAITAVIFKALIGLITAHLVNNLPAKGQRKWRGMLLVPWVIALALCSLGWGGLLQS